MIVARKGGSEEGLVATVSRVVVVDDVLGIEHLRMVFKLFTSSPNVTGQDPLGVHVVSSLDGINQEAVLRIDNPLAIRSRETEIGAPVVLRCVPEPRYHGCQKPYWTCAVGEFVQIAIQCEETLDIGSVLNVRLQPFEFGVVARRQKRDALCQGKRLDSLSDHVERLTFLLIESRDPGPTVGTKCGESLRLQNAQGLAHGKAARTKLRGYLLLPNPSAGRQLAGKNHCSKRTRDPLTGN